MLFAIVFAFPLFLQPQAPTPAPAPHAATITALPAPSPIGAVSPGATGRRVAVVCLGPDAETTGQLQRALEDRLAQLPGLTLVRNDLGAPPPVEETTRASDPAADGEVKALFEEAHEAYVDGDYARALDRLAAMTTIRQRFGGGGRAEQVQLLLWRASTFLKLGAEMDAEAEATEAINLQPDVEVDRAAQSQQLADLVRVLRAKLPPAATVTLEGIPATASVRVDGRPTARVFRVLQGPHRVKISAPGWQSWEKVVVIDGNKTLTPGFALALEKDVAQRLAEATWWGSLAADDDGALTKLFRRTGADYLLVVATRPGSPALARSMLIAAERTSAVVHGGVIPIDAVTAVRIADLALTTARPDASIDIAINPPSPGLGSDTAVLKAK